LPGSAVLFAQQAAGLEDSRDLTIDVLQTELETGMKTMLDAQANLVGTLGIQQGVGGMRASPARASEVDAAGTEEEMRLVTIETIVAIVVFKTEIDLRVVRRARSTHQVGVELGSIEAHAGMRHGSAFFAKSVGRGESGRQTGPIDDGFSA